jgi:hypothetical protein
VIHRKTLSNSIYQEKHKFSITIGAYTPFLFFTALILIPVLLVINSQVLSLVTKILLMALIVILLLITVVLVLNKWGPKQSYALKQIRFSAVIFLLLSTVTVLLVFWSTQTHPTQFLAANSPQVTQSPSSTPIPNSVNWIENHPKTADVIIALTVSIIGFLGTLLTVWATMNSRKNK